MDPDKRKKVLQEVIDRLNYVEGFLEAIEKVISEHPVKGRNINYEVSSFKLPQKEN